MADQVSAVVDNVARERFELVENGHLAYASYRRVGNEVTIPYVEAADALRGTGAASRLMAGVVAHARTEGLKVMPTCGYAVSWFRRNPEASDVLK
ncbi:MAG: N-acetyltransferase [Rhodospirillaceae bacterium]|nr:MAG: N-acetyltransferase [Rhodospirillaceae bacterium]